MIFLKYSYKQLNLLLLLAVAFLLLLSYRKNIAPTLDLRTQCRQMQLQAEQAGNAQTRLQALRSEQKKLNRISGNSALSNEEIRQAIMGHIRLYPGTVTVTAIKEPHQYTGPKMDVLTHAVDIQGNFRSLIQVTHAFESRFTDARLSAARYFSVEDSRTKKIVLYATCYFQNFKKH